MHSTLEQILWSRYFHVGKIRGENVFLRKYYFNIQSERFGKISIVHVTAFVFLIFQGLGILNESNTTFINKF